MPPSQQLAPETAVHTAARVVERAVDDELERLDQASDAELTKLRQQRMRELRQAAERRTRWRELHHGEVNCVDTTEAFFEATRTSERVVAVFGRAAPGASATREVVESLEVALQAVARQHLETKFIRVDAERCPWLCEQLGITVLPSLVLVQQGKVVRVLHGLDTLWSASQQRSSGIAPAALERVLRNAGMAWEAAAAAAAEE